MVTPKKVETVKFEYEGMEFEAVKSELESYKTNKQLNLGGSGFYLAVSRLFAGRDEEYAEKVGGTHAAFNALVNAAFAENAKAKN